MEPLSKLDSRFKIGSWFHKNVANKGEAKIAEIGVFRGWYAKDMITQIEPKEYWGIDMWRYDLPDSIHIGEDFQREGYLATLNTLKCFVGSSNTGIPQARLIVSDSITAAKLFPDGYFDMVYIDADHSHKGVALDMIHWLPKVRLGGVLGGHDYVSSVKEHNGAVYGVMDVVDRFCDVNKITPIITPENGSPKHYQKEPSWYFRVESLNYNTTCLDEWKE